MFLVGNHVQVTPKSREDKEFWAFFDGYRGVVRGMNNGFVEVVCQHPEGPKTLFIQPENLTAI